MVVVIFGPRIILNFLSVLLCSYRGYFSFSFPFFFSFSFSLLFIPLLYAAIKNIFYYEAFFHDIWCLIIWKRYKVFYFLNKLYMQDSHYKILLSLAFCYFLNGIKIVGNLNRLEISMWMGLMGQRGNIWKQIIDNEGSSLRRWYPQSAWFPLSWC